MPRVQILSDELINQIAAGEVVERPASVLKELGENALDAGARSIRVAVRGGGIEALSVTDDGCGMPPDDAQRALLRHATSKLREERDLLALTTLGFRGEALAAISAVSRLTLTTAETKAVASTRIVSEGGQVLRVEESAPVPGTRIEVEDLFFNVPARRKFLKRLETETKHLEEAWLRLALAHPQVGFFLDVDGERRLSAPPTDDLRERLALAVGTEVYPHLLPLEERQLGLRVHGFVASPEFSLSNARGLYTFVNGRYVRDRGLIAALQRGLGGALPPGRQPVALIFLELDPAMVDVNVHPQKTEVRFADGRGVSDALHAAVSRAIRSVPWQNSSGSGFESPASPAHYAQAVERFLARAQSPVAADGPPPFGASSAPAPGINEASPAGYFSSLRFLAQLGTQFLVMEGPGSTLVVLDAHAISERLHAERFWSRLESSNAHAPTSGLGGGTVQIARAERARLLEQGPHLERLGIELEAFDGDTLALRAVPPALLGADLTDLLTELASVLPGPGDAPDDFFGEAISLLSCFAAGHEKRERAEEEVRSWMRALELSPPRPGLRHTRCVVLEVPQLELLRRASAKLGPTGVTG
jgi:DNA mismatch repair protein MutL